MPRRHYTEADRAIALAKLKANDGNLERTSRECGIPRETIRRWKNEPDRAAPPDVRQEKEAEVLALIESALIAVLGKIPHAEGNVQQYAMAAGILVDKQAKLKTPAAADTPDGQPMRVEMVWPDYAADGKVVPIRQAM